MDYVKLGYMWVMRVQQMIFGTRLAMLGLEQHGGQGLEVWSWEEKHNLH
jgi:hypothetical protein